MLGTTLAHYEITDLLGKGGMGEVYRARDTRLGRDVALKLLPSGMADDPERLARFEQEARTVAGLNHPNIVTLFSVEDAGGVRFLTMELVSGRPLDDRVSSGGMPLDEVVQVGSALADALAAAHANGVVHRDLKPANVMLTESGTVKVLDFGIAKAGGAHQEPASTHAETRATPITAAGQVTGTVPYMAPEQIRGGAVDSRTDLFALGVVLYELATGQRPFRGSSSAEILGAILRDEPVPLTALRTDLPAGLERVVARCLKKDPGDRYQTALEIANDLRRAETGEAVGVLLVPPPTPSTPLLGREAHVEQAAAVIREGARVLTVSGYGGTGKTRFSIELFRRLAPEFEGAAFASLAAVTDAAEVLPTVATLLDIAEAHGRSALDALATVLGERRMLLVLDNLEQVLPAGEDIAALVARCPNLQVVATSRAPLRIGAETEFPLPPLALPAETSTVDELRDCPSVALFVQRAGKVKPGFTLTEENAEAVSNICRQLDGLPLALELAAARVRILDPSRLLQRLDRALDLLTSGDRDLPLRQRTLRATISWSYSLLEPDEQQLLRRLSVFHEGWTFPALEAVCYGEDDRWRALDELESLVEKGLVRVVGAGERYALLETIRAFATEQLHAGGEMDRLRAAHAAYFVRYTGEERKEFLGTGQVAAQRRVRADNANELAAIHWLLGEAHAGDDAALEDALLLCGHLDWFWHVAGQHNTARGLVDEALELARDRTPSRGRGLAYLAAGMVSSTTDEFDRSLEEWGGGYREGLALGDEDMASEGCMGMGYVLLNCGRLAEARPVLEESIRRSGNGVSDFIRSLSMEMLGMLEFQEGNLDEGMRLVEEGIRIQDRVGDCEGGGIGLSFLAQMHFARGNPGKAREVYARSLATFEEVGDRPEIARVLCETGWTALADADPPAARTAFRQAVQVYEEVGSARGTGLALLGLAAVEEAEGRSERAVAIAEAAQALAERAGVVCDHPMDPGVVERIEALKVSIPRKTVDGLTGRANALTPAQVLAMVTQPGAS